MAFGGMSSHPQRGSRDRYDYLQLTRQAYPYLETQVSAADAILAAWRSTPGAKDGPPFSQNSEFFWPALKPKRASLIFMSPSSSLPKNFRETIRRQFSLALCAGLRKWRSAPSKNGRLVPARQHRADVAGFLAQKARRPVLADREDGIARVMKKLNGVQDQPARVKSVSRLGLAA
jgi:hypothetical protein